MMTLPSSFERLVEFVYLERYDDLPDLAKRHSADEILIAMPSMDGDLVRRVVDLARNAGVDYRTIPSVRELLVGDASISRVREVAIEDLLRRGPVRLDMEEIGDYVADKIVMVTGAGGSIGSEIVRQVARFKPHTLVLLGRGESSIHRIQRELLCTDTGFEHHPVITDIRDPVSLADVFRRFRPQVIFHAAAHKHVPLMESNPEQAVFNNVGGTCNLIELALRHNAERFVNISTDKAVNPTSIMGATKRVAELVVQHAARECSDKQTFVSVRFGNVLGSRGSVIPIFKEQVEQGGPVTVTHPEMERYFMTIPEAAQLVLQAGSMAENGAVYVLNMGEPVRIVDLARDLIRLSGLEPDRDIEIHFTGIRPGEKLHEELFTTAESTTSSNHEKIYFASQSGLSQDENFDNLLDSLFAAASCRDTEEIRKVLRRVLYSPVPVAG